MAPAPLLRVSVFLGMLVNGALWATLPALLGAETGHGAQYGRVLGVANATSLLLSVLMGRLSDSITRVNAFRIAVIFAAICPACMLAGLTATSPTTAAVGSNPEPESVISSATTAASTQVGALVIAGAVFSRLRAPRVISRALVVDTSSEESRAASLGLLSAASGIGFVIGPTLGGWLAARAGNRSAAQMCAALALINVAVSFSLRGEGAGTLAGNSKASSTATSASEPTDKPSTTLILKAVSAPRVRLLLTIQLFLSLGFQAFTAMFAAYCKRRFDFGQATYGNVLSFCGFVWASTQGLLVPWLNRSGSLPDYQILRWSTTSLCLGRLVLAAAYAWPWLLVGEALVVVGAATSFTLLSSETSKIVPPAVVGSVVGITAAIDSGCGILMPPLMGQLFDAYGDASGALVSALCTAVGLLLVVFGLGPRAKVETKVKQH